MALAKTLKPAMTPISIQKSRKISDKIFIKHKDRRVGVYIKDILYVQADRNYCTVVTQQKKYVLSVPLKKFASVIMSDLFQRIHRSFLVNIESIEVLDDHYIYINGQSFPVSKAYKKDLFSKFAIV